MDEREISYVELSVKVVGAVAADREPLPDCVSEYEEVNVRVMLSDLVGDCSAEADLVADSSLVA